MSKFIEVENLYTNLTMEVALDTFCTSLPKVELHAHINGSLSEQTLRELCSLQKLPPNREDVVLLQSIIDRGQQRSLSECFDMFKIVHCLTSTPEALHKATVDVIREFAEDGVVYLELRSTPKHIPGKISREDYVGILIQAIRESRKKLDIVVKLLLSIDRRNGILEAEDTMHLAVKYSECHRDILVGLDLSGDPTKCKAEDYFPVLQKAKEHELGISVHCAEVPNAEEIKKIIMLKPDRIGHGTFIHAASGGSEELWNMLLQSSIPVEMCLTSNVKSGTVKNYESHHFQQFKRVGHPLCLATDDKGVFATTLSEEFKIAAKTFNLSKEEMWKLNYDALDFTFSTDDEKSVLKKRLQQWKLENM